MSTKKRTQIVILGGGFGGVYAAIELEKTLARDANIHITLINRDNFFLFTPMLHEVAASDLDITHIVNPVRKLLKKIEFFDGDLQSIDLSNKCVTVTHGIGEPHKHEIEYDHLIIALGSITNFFDLPGLEERALTMKSLGDAIHFRNRLIQHLEEADFECCPFSRKPLLTFVVAGGGFAGAETIASVNDFLREAIRFYPHLTEDMLRLVLVHPGPLILPELGEKLGRYAEQKLARRKVEIRVNTRVTGFSGHGSESQRRLVHHDQYVAVDCGNVTQSAAQRAPLRRHDPAHRRSPTARPYPVPPRHRLQRFPLMLAMRQSADAPSAKANQPEAPFILAQVSRRPTVRLKTGARTWSPDRRRNSPAARTAPARSALPPASAGSRRALVQHLERIGVEVGGEVCRHRDRAGEQRVVEPHLGRHGVRRRHPMQRRLHLAPVGRRVAAAVAGS